MPKLVIKPGTPQAQDFELKPGKNYIGRGFANDLKLEDASVSSSHAVIEVNGHVVTITDLGSTNGTRVNQLPATGSPLQSGQILKLGAIELLFMADASAPAGPSVVPPPPTAAAAQIATEFVIRDPSRVGVAPVASPPPPTPVPAIGELRIPRITPVASQPPPPPVPIVAAPAPVAQNSGIRVPNLAPIAAPPSAPPAAAPAPVMGELRIPGVAPVPAPKPAQPETRIPVPAPAAPPPPVPIVAAPAPPPQKIEKGIISPPPWAKVEPAPAPVPVAPTSPAVKSEETRIPVAASAGPPPPAPIVPAPAPQKAEAGILKPPPWIAVEPAPAPVPVAPVAPAPPPPPPAPIVAGRAPELEKIETRLPSAALSPELERVPVPAAIAPAAPVPIPLGNGLNHSATAAAPPPAPIVTAPAPQKIETRLVSPAPEATFVEASVPAAVTPPTRAPMASSSGFNNSGTVVAPPPAPPVPVKAAPAPAPQLIETRFAGSAPQATLVEASVPAAITSPDRAPMPSGGGFNNSRTAVAPLPAPNRAVNPIATAPLAPTIPAGTIQPPAGKTVCKFHRNTAGQWLCQKCNELFCSLCVGSQPTPNGVGYFCRTCGTQCVPVKVKIIPKKEKKRVVYSDGTVLLRTIGFGLGGAIAGAGLWIGCAALTGTDFPPIFAPIIGVLCGVGVKIAGQDRPGGFFSGTAAVSTLLGVALGKLGAVMITHIFLFTGTSLALAIFGLLLGMFLAWKIGGGDF